MRRLAAVALALFLAAPAFAEVGYSRVSATTASQTVTVGANNLIIINDDDTDSIYVRIFFQGDTTAAATSSNFEIKHGESFTFERLFNISHVSVVSANASIARLIWW